MKAIIRKDDQAVSPVIATILMVAITVVLAAVLYVMVSGLISGPGASKPFVTFSSATVQGTNVTFTVASASIASTLNSYKVNILQDTVAVGTGAQTLVSGATGMTFGAIKVVYTDISGNGQLKSGDIVKITGLSTGHAYQFVLIWASDGSSLQTVSWNT